MSRGEDNNDEEMEELTGERGMDMRNDSVRFLSKTIKWLTPSKD